MRARPRPRLLAAFLRRSVVAEGGFALRSGLHEPHHRLHPPADRSRPEAWQAVEPVAPGPSPGRLVRLSLEARRASLDRRAGVRSAPLRAGSSGTSASATALRPDQGVTSRSRTASSAAPRPSRRCRPRPTTTAATLPFQFAGLVDLADHIVVEPIAASPTISSHIAHISHAEPVQLRHCPRSAAAARCSPIQRSTSATERHLRERRPEHGPRGEAKGNLLMISFLGAASRSV